MQKVKILHLRAGLRLETKGTQIVNIKSEEWKWEKGKSNYKNVPYSS